MPNGDTQTQPQGRDNPIALAFRQKERIKELPPKLQLRMADMLYRRFMLPQEARVNKKLTVEDVENLRAAFTAKLLDIPGVDTTVRLHEEKPSYGVGTKALAIVGAAGMGVAGGVKNLLELKEKIASAVLPSSMAFLRKPENWLAGQLGKVESRFGEMANVAPTGAAVGGAVGHLIPSAIAAEAGAGLVPGAGAGAGMGARMLRGAGQGAMAGAAGTGAYTTNPDDILKNALIGGGLGGLLGVFIRPRLKGKPSAAPTTEAAKTPTNLSDFREIVSQKKFGKPFSQLTQAERVQLPAAVKAEIAEAQKAARAAKAASKKVDVKATKQELSQLRRQLAEVEAKEAAQRRATGVSAVAAQGVAENPQAAKAVASVKSTVEAMKPGEGTSAVHLTDEPPKTNVSQQKASYESEIERAKGILKNSAATEEEKNVAKTVLKDSRESLAKLEKPTVTKVPEGEHGKGKLAEQAKARERMAASREESIRTQQMASLEEQAKQLAGRATPASLANVSVVELEDVVKELDPSGMILSGAREAIKRGKLSQEMYPEILKEWLLSQFEKVGYEAPK